MAADAIVGAFSHFPDIVACTDALNDFVSTSPPGSPVLSTRRRKGGHKAPSWPMPRALFLLDEKRVVPQGGKKEPSSIDELVDALGCEEAQKSWEAAPSATHDKQHEAVLRSLAAVLKAAVRGLAPNEPSVIDVAMRLVTMVDTEHGDAASACLVQLSRACPAAAAELMGPLRQLLKEGQSQVSRRRAAVGFGSVVKGLGLGAVFKYGVMDFLAGLVSDQGNANGRQAGIFCYESLFRLFGYPFEPYVPKLVPYLIASFDDQGIPY